MLTAGAIALPAETDPAHGAGVATEDCGPPPVPPPPPPPTMRTSRDTIPAGTCQGLVETGVRTTSQVPSSAAVGEPSGQTVLDDPADETRGITMRIAPVAAATTIVAIVARRDTIARRPTPVVDMRPEPPLALVPTAAYDAGRNKSRTHRDDARMRSARPRLHDPTVGCPTVHGRATPMAWQVRRMAAVTPRTGPDPTA